ncbi:MAG: hypothetical protein E7231_07240 [Cellulosilyticum sp.]|nr:hypothetical protein [Cellulosilyticum sp.]
MGVLKETFNQYKWTILAGIIVAILIALITANFHVLQFLGYKMQNNTEGVLSIIKTQARHEETQDDWFFEQGMQYLMRQEEYSEELTSFFEEQYSDFTVEWKKAIISAYNDKRLSLPMSKEVMDVLVQYIDDESIRSYLTRLSLDDFEQGLVLTYGNDPEVDDVLVDSLYKLLTIYPEKLSFNKFQFNLYDVLNYSGENAEEKIRYIFSKVEPSVAKENIFKQLRNEEITEEQLCDWVEFFNSTGIIAASEYRDFNEIYGNICLIRSQYNALDGEEVELKNIIAAVDAKISEQVKQLEEKESQVAPLESEISQIETTLDSLTNSSYISLYIEKSSGTGSHEYIASVPRNGLFGMKPSDLKYIIKLNSTSFVKDGVYNLSLYYKGTKTGTTGAQYDYYEEVSESDLAKIETMKDERSSKLATLETLKQEVSQITSEINQAKVEGKYEQAKQALADIAGRRSEYSNKINEEVVKIRTLFGLSNIVIDLNKA